MAYTVSKAYDLRNVKYQGTRIGGTDQISTCPIQYQGTPVTYIRYKNTNIMHRYNVWSGDEYKEEYDYVSDFDEGIVGAYYSVSSTTKGGGKRTNIPAPEPYRGNLAYEYDITKWELTKTSGVKNEDKYYLYSFTIKLSEYYDVGSFIERNRIRIDKYDYLSTEDISLDELAAQIEDASGGTEGFTPPWNLGISTSDILKKTRRERERIDDVTRTGNFTDFINTENIVEGTVGSWGFEEDYSTYCGIFNQAVEGLIVNYYTGSSSSSLMHNDGNGAQFNFKRVVESKSAIDLDHVYIANCECNSDYSSCFVGSSIDSRHPVSITDASGESRSSEDFKDFSLIFLICSSCSNFALSDGQDRMVLTYYREDFTRLNGNLTYNNWINSRDY